jgi:HK97 family phage major capsid protein
MAPLTATRTRAELLLDERGKIESKREALLNDANNRTDSNFSEEEKDVQETYRTRTEQIDEELVRLNETLAREERADEASKTLRGHLVGRADGVEMDGEDVVYRTFAAYARDRLVSDQPQIRDKVEREMGLAPIQDAKERLMRAQTLYRAPEHTLSSDVAGLLPPQHIAQIMDIINAERPVVATANRVDLSSGSLTWPKIAQRPIVRVQGTEKTEVTSRKMSVTMESESADTYLGAGNLSWQTINWSTPAALELFFRLMAEAYAIQTEANACHVLGQAASTVGGGAALAGTSSDSFEDWLAAVLAGFSQVYDATNTTPNTIYLSPDMFVLAAGVTSDTRVMLIEAGALNLPSLSGQISGIRVVTSRGFPNGTAIVGDSRALLVGETPGAPVELRAVEPAIGGLEVGVIGAFRAISFDDERFADIGPTT